MGTVLLETDAGIVDATLIIKLAIVQVFAAVTADEVDGRDNSGVAKLNDSFRVLLVELIFTSFVPLLSLLVTSTVDSEALTFKSGSLAKLNDLKALSFGTTLAAVVTSVSFSGNNELDNMEPKFSEFVPLVLVGADLTPNRGVF